MKKSHIIAIIVIAVAIGAIISMVSDAATYADFQTAEKFPGKEFQVVGQLNKVLFLIQFSWVYVFFNYW